MEEALGGSESDRMNLIEHIITKRLTNLEYLKRVHRGKAFWLNIVQLSPDDIVSSYDSTFLQNRTCIWFSLGVSLGRLIPNPNGPSFIFAVARVFYELDALVHTPFTRGLKTFSMKKEKPLQSHKASFQEPKSSISSLDRGRRLSFSQQSMVVSSSISPSTLTPSASPLSTVQIPSPTIHPTSPSSSTSQTSTILLGTLTTIPITATKKSYGPRHAELRVMWEKALVDPRVSNARLLSAPLPHGLLLDYISVVVGLCETLSTVYPKLMDRCVKHPLLARQVVLIDGLIKHHFIGILSREYSIIAQGVIKRKMSEVMDKFGG
ncbi:hypothetical protein ADUPG1_010442 [Aduncisulcus paluster]|uniref:Uncharacterized protein n=1 Tax=Aduncisulcus paluster TaxID=2918883 RepID=A0ABQ5JW10_9EUKA|nr:hypothetical protein ADUPG1_010442 [Aduncisulcus paluster]